MAKLTRSELKKILDDYGVTYKASSTVTELQDLIKEHETNSDEEQQDEMHSQSNGNGSKNVEIVLSEEIIESKPKAVKSGLKVVFKICEGNHSSYADTEENFPSEFGGRYSIDYLTQKRLIK